MANPILQINLQTEEMNSLKEEDSQVDQMEISQGMTQIILKISQRSPIEVKNCD
jgi:hypothetical protein